MKNIERKLKVLSTIAKELNQKSITWAVGASLLLYFKEITTEFYDIDIMVAEEDVKALKEIMLSFGDMQPPNPHSKYKTKYFLEFIIEDIEIDVMAGFTIVNEEREYYFPLKKDSIYDYTEVNGIKIPLQSLLEWHNFYKLMGREEKVAMIEKYI